MIKLTVPETPVIHGDVFKITVEWSSQRPVMKIRCRLAWRLAISGVCGSSTIAATEELDDLDRDGKREVSFTLPEGAYAFGSPHMKLDWVVDAALLPGKETAVEVLPSAGRGASGPAKLEKAAPPPELGLPFWCKQVLKG